MRKISFIPAVLAIAGIFVFHSCAPETTVEPPILSVTPVDDLSAGPGDLVTYQVVASSETDLKKIEISGKINTSLVLSTDTVFAAGIKSAVFSFAFEVPLTATTGSVIEIDFTATNDGEQTVVTRKVEVAAGQINTYTAVIMSDLENPEGSSFYSVASNELMSLNQAVATPAKVDILYYYGATNKAVLCSPMDQAVRAFTDLQGRIIVDRLTTKNDTRIAVVEMSVSDFNAVINDGPILAKKPAVTATSAMQLAKDKVLHVQTVAGKQALVLVKNITGTQGTSWITIEVKVQI